MDYIDSNLSQIKLIVLDLGGTLLQNDNTISEIDQKAILNLQKQNKVKIAIATARMLSSTPQIVHSINCDYAIYSNGSFIYDLKQKREIYSKCIDYLYLKKLIKFANENDLSVHFNQKFLEFSNKWEYFALKHKLLNERNPSNIPSKVCVFENIEDHIKQLNDIIKIVFISERNLDSVYELLKEFIANDDLYITEYYKNCYESVIDKTINYIEVGAGNDNKYLGIQMLAKELNIHLNEILFIGDGENDLEVFKNLPYTVCMGNGQENIKQIATFVSKSNENNGVAYALQKCLKGESK